MTKQEMLLDIPEGVEIFQIAHDGNLESFHLGLVPDEETLNKIQVLMNNLFQEAPAKTEIEGRFYAIPYNASSEIIFVIIIR
jgi:hypothetical protein